MFERFYSKSYDSNYKCSTEKLRKPVVGASIPKVESKNKYISPIDSDSNSWDKNVTLHADDIKLRIPPVWLLYY